MNMRYPLKSGVVEVVLEGDVRASLCQFCDQTDCGINREKACVQSCTIFMEKVLENEVRHTIHEWEILKNVIIMDPDGFNRKDPDLAKRRFTEKEFDDALPLCTAMIASPGSRTVFWASERISNGISTLSQADADLIGRRLAEVARGSAKKCSMHNIDEHERAHQGCNGCRIRSECARAKFNKKCGAYEYASCEDDL